MVHSSVADRFVAELLTQVGNLLPTTYYLHLRLQPPTPTVAASITYGCSLHHLRLQPPSAKVAACITYGCSLHYLRLQVAAKKVGLPWEDGVSVTPLPEPSKPQYLEALIADALAAGATLANAATGGGERRGALKGL